MVQPYFRTVGRLLNRRPPTTGMRARLTTRHGVWGSDDALIPTGGIRLPAAGPTDVCDTRSGVVAPWPPPFGREHTTPIVQTRGGASLRDEVARRRPDQVLSLTCFAASEPGSFGGRRRSAGGGPGTAGMARLQDVRRWPSGSLACACGNDRRLGKRGGDEPRTRHLRSAPRRFSDATSAGPFPFKV